MQQDLETTLKEFLSRAKAHFDQQNATLAEYERFFNRAQELFPAYAEFVQHVNDALSSIQDAQEQPNSRSTPSQRGSSKTSSLPKMEAVLGTAEKKKILIVDDAEINRVLMGHFFKNLPVLLEFASSGEQALVKVNHHCFDLVLMDLQMKGMSGIDTIKSIRDAQPENIKKTQIIAITNLEPSEEERNQAIAMGANEYLSKSMSRETLRERVFEFLISPQSISA